MKSLAFSRYILAGMVGALQIRCDALQSAGVCTKKGCITYETTTERFLVHLVRYGWSPSKILQGMAGPPETV